MTAPARVVVVGAGFGGMAAARRLMREDVDLTVLDCQNYHLFQPLLYQVATTTLQPADVAAPVRRMLSGRRQPTVFMDEVTGIDRARRRVQTRWRELGYDYLVLAPGARTSYFGNDAWRERTYALKTLDDAIRLRHQILLAFERAEMAEDEDERQRLMTFAVVGGGANGVGVAAATAELAHKVLNRDFRRIHPEAARILLIEAADRILGTYPRELTDYAQRTLEAKGVEVRVGAPVSKVEDDAVHIGDAGERLETATVLWTAGVEARQVPGWLDVDTDPSGRVKVAPDLSLPGDPSTYVVGDAALVNDEDGNPLPGLASVAKQEGRHAAERIAARIAGDTRTMPFRYRDYGTLVPLGRGKAIAQAAGRTFTGFPAWLLWAAAHIVFEIDMRRRLLVLINWSWSFLSSRNGARIIVDSRGTTASRTADRARGKREHSSAA